jgi:hypothetical protein
MSRRSRDVVASAPWTGRTRRYDIVKEGVVAILVVGVIALALSALFSSPDDKVLTFKGWASSNPQNLYITAVAELAGESESAGYGPPYNDASEGLNTGPIHMQKWMGVRIPVNPAQDFVITPLSQAQQPAPVTSGLNAWNAASQDQRDAWSAAYWTALGDAAPDGDPANADLTKVANGDYGPVPTLALGLTAMAKSGAYDGVLMAQSPTGEPGFYQTDYTKQILFLGDGAYLDDAATKYNLQGNTWGMMNETHSYPGQAWLWLYSFWYQIPPFNNEESAPFGSNADAWIFWIMAVLSLLLMLLPFIPGLRSIPRWIPIHRLIWRDFYRSEGLTGRRQ